MISVLSDGRFQRPGIFTVLLLYVLFIYILAVAIEKSGKRKKKLKDTLAAISILVSLTMLAFYKYAKYYHASPFAIADTATEQPMVEIVVPLGLSFIVFSGISYSIDVYSGESCGTPLDVFTYMFFFPKLISGPIVQWKEFSPQLNKRTFSVEQISVGIDYIIIGLAKKLIIADVFGAQISFINETAATTGIDIQTVWLRSLLFFFQLYYDFSGYSDIAIGLSRIFGFSIRQNFNYPYLSTSVSEFWRRWHISLGAWFRRYVYIPLGGSRNGNVYVNLFIVFLLTGIWHGDDWTYVLWGVINGIAVVIERALKDTRFYQKIPKLIKWGFTVLFVYFAWVLFMSNDIGEALSPDNWAFTPAIQLTEGNVLSFWVAAQDPSYPEEHYAVYISEENPGVGLPESSTLLFEETIGSGSYTPVQTRVVDGRTYNRYFVNIPAAFNNKVAYIGFRHFNCYDMFILNLDDVMVTEGNPDLEPEPDPEPDPTWLENFDATLTGWTYIDSDGDGYGWQVGSSTAGFTTHSGTGLLFSQSYDSNHGALTPDNWAFTPGITLTSGNYLSFWVAAQDSDYPEEHYAVYITDQAPNASNLTSCVKLHEETIDGADAATPVETSGKYRRFIIAIPSQFANKTVYIGFRHFNCTDMFYLNLDDVAIYDKNPKEVSSGTILSAAPVRSVSSKPKGIYSADKKNVKSKSLTRK